MNCKSEPDSELVAEFARVLGKYKPEAIQAAFRGWRDVSPFFPTIADVRELINVWHRVTRENAERAAQAGEERKTGEARKQGNLVDFAQIKKKFIDLVEEKGLPEIERNRRSYERRTKEHRPLPAITLTPEQIEARREAELAEINAAGKS